VRFELQSIISGMRVGERLPSERELSEKWDVARMTVRRAMDELFKEGAIERRHGSGTFVAPRPFVRALGLTSFSEDMKNRGLVPGSKLISFQPGIADTIVAKRLHVTPGTPVYKFTRLRLATGEPMALETVWIKQSLVPGLSEFDLGGSLYKTLTDRYRISVGAATVTIGPIIPEEPVQKLLEIGSTQGCLLIEMIDSDLRGNVIMYARCTYRGDKYQLTADVSGAAFARGSSREQQR
jgi:GntR family transcriptional regulator